MIRRWREIERWIEDGESAHAGVFPERPLSDFITRKVAPIDCEVRPLDQLNVIAKITFGGELHIRNEEAKRCYKGPLFQADPGDLIISKIRVAQGSLCVVPDSLDHLAVSAEYPVYEIDNSTVRTEYLRLVIRSTAFQARVGRLRSGNTTKARIRPAQFEKLKFPLPSVDEQDALIADYSAALHRAVKLEQEAEAIERAGWHAFEKTLGVVPSLPLPDRPVFVASFKDVDRWSHESILRASTLGPEHTHSWALSRLGDLIEDLENGWSPKCHSHPAQPGKWGVLKLGAVSFGTFDSNENKELPANLQPRPEYEIQNGDVLISRANVVRYVGACVYVDSTPPKLMICDKIFRVRFRPEGELIPLFLTEAMKLHFVREQIESSLTGTSPTMKNISKPALMNLSFPLPDRTTQQLIVESLSSARNDASTKRTEAAVLRQSAWAAFESALFTTEEAAA